MDIKPVWEEKSDLPLAGGRRASGLFHVIFSGRGARWFLYGGTIAVGLVSLLTGWPGAGPYGAEPQPAVVTRRQVEVEVTYRPVVKTITLVQTVPVPVGAVAQVPYPAEAPDGAPTVVRAQVPEAAAPARIAEPAPVMKTTAQAPAATPPAHSGEATGVSAKTARTAKTAVVAAKGDKAVAHEKAKPAAFDPSKVALETGKPATGGAGDNVYPTPAATSGRPSPKREDAAPSKPTAAKTSAPKTVPGAPKPAVAKAPSNDVVFISSEDPPPSDAPSPALPTVSAPEPTPPAPPAVKAKQTAPAVAARTAPSVKAKQTAPAVAARTAPLPAASPGTVPGFEPLSYTPPPVAAAPRRPVAPPGSPVTLVGRLAPPTTQAGQVNGQVMLVDMTSGATIPGALQNDGGFSFGGLRSGSLYYIVAWMHVRGVAGGNGGGTSASELRMSWHQVIQATDAGTFSVDLSRGNCDGDYTTDVLPASAVRSPGSGRRADLVPIGGG